MQVPQERLLKVLELYKPECRYLIRADTEHPKANGIFRLGNTYYTSRKLTHITAIEAQLCLNQLCYAAFGEWLPQGRFDQTISFEKFLELMKENMFIVESNIRFRKPIPASEEVNG